MGYASLQAAIDDLPGGELLRIDIETDPHLEMAEIHRRIHAAGGPAILFERVKGSPFRALSNLYGTQSRTAYLFRQELEAVQRLIRLKADPAAFLHSPGKYLGVPFTALNGLPLRSRWRKPILFGRTTLGKLPQVVSWPMDGGPFVTLPQVFTLPPGSRNVMDSNIGMYRIQLGGNDYIADREAGMHYQLHRGIGVHHTLYNQTRETFRASVFIGGPPSHAFAAIMPLPEGLSEVTFAGLLNNRRFRYLEHAHHILATDADFVITGRIRPDEKKPEGPFGDHLGYYSLRHDFPVFEIDAVYHRQDPIWHFTVVGRPPQEDSNFGWLIHQLVEPLAPREFPGLEEVHAVDAAGVHPLLLAIGNERYMPFREPVPEELLTIANHLLGKGQTSLAKYLFIACRADAPSLRTHDMAGFFRHMLERIDLRRDLHFQTKTTMDTLDYSGEGWNAGSKLVVAARGPAIRRLGIELPSNLRLPSWCRSAHVVLPGIVAVSVRRFADYPMARVEIRELASHLDKEMADAWPIWILTEDSDWMASRLDNFLWAAFTRSQPARDIHGVGESVIDKHWGCDGPLLLDARIKPHHAPVLETDPVVSRRVDALFASGGPLHGKVKGL